MPNTHSTLTGLFDDIANAIRAKTGSEEQIVADNFPAAIEAIPSGGGADIIQHTDIPAYVKAEALALAAKVKAVQAQNSITFIVGSDAHQNDNVQNIVAGNLHAGMAMKIISYALKIDFAAFLGDYTVGAPTRYDQQGQETQTGTTIAEGLQHISEINADIAESFRGLPQFRTTGNHDPLTYSHSHNQDYLSLSELKPLIADYNGIDNTTVKGDATSGYCYRDFDAKKVRVICLNTAEVTAEPSGDGSSENMSDAQKQWFAEALRGVGVKGSTWSVLVFSHHPLDWGVVYAASHIIKAYVNGESISIGGTTYNFSGANGASFIGAFHGHTHCYKIDQLHQIVWDPVSEKSIGELYDYAPYRIAVPNMCYERNNEYGKQETDNNKGTYYGIFYGDPRAKSYEKTPLSGTDTAFCVVTIDLDNKLIYAFHYGAGPTENNKCRLQSYNTDITFYNVSSTLVKSTLDGPMFVREGATYTGTLSPLTEEISGESITYPIRRVIIKMGGVDITNNTGVYNASTGEISISNVSGDISIVALPYVNLVPTSKAANGVDPYLDPYVQNPSYVGYSVNTRLQSGSTEKHYDASDPTYSENTDANHKICSGWIPYDGANVPIIRFAFLDNDGHITWGGNYVAFYKSDLTPVTVNGGTVMIGHNEGSQYRVSNGVITDDPAVIYANNSTVLNRIRNEAAWIKCSIYAVKDSGIPDEPFIVTVGEKIYT